MKKQFRTTDLFVFMTCAAAAAWLYTIGLAIVIPVLIGALAGVRAKNSDYPILLGMLGGAALGIGLIIVCFTTYFSFLSTAPIGGGFVKVFQILTVISWLITLILFLQFLKLTRPVTKDAAEDPTAIDQPV